MSCTIPKTNPNHGKNPTSWWDENCEKAIKDKRNALKKLRKTCHPSDLVAYKRTSAIARRTIKNAKRLDWEHFCNNLNLNTNTKIIWNKIKRIGQPNSINNIPVIKHNGVDAISDQDKTDALVDSFAKVSSTDNYGSVFKNNKTKADNDLIINDDNNSVINDPLTIQELNHAIDCAKCTSPGKDGISNTVIKHLPIKIREFLLIIFNMIWNASQCPKQWKEAILIPILKPGKDHANTLSYRPIALTSTICKLMERIVNSRLMWYLETNNLLTQHQSGFRKGRSTKDHIINLESSINKALANKESTLAVFLDIEKAYDMLWRGGIIIKLQVMGIYGRMTHWIHDFLNDRKIQVRINNNLSKERIQENGVPQGSVISPLLFNIAVNDLSCHLPNVHISQYADDIAIWKSNRNIPFIEKKIQQSLNKVRSWCEKWGFKLSTPKTIAVLFSNKKQTNIYLALQNNPVQILQSTRFLGVILDGKLTWKQHIDNIVTKCKRKLNLFRCISGTSWGLIARPYFKSTQPSSDQLLNMEVKLLTLHLLQ